MFSTFFFSDLCPAAQPLGQCPDYFQYLNISRPWIFPTLNISHLWIFPTHWCFQFQLWIFPTREFIQPWMFLTSWYFSPQNISHLRIFLTPQYFSLQNISHLNISHPILPLQPLLPLPGFTHDWILSFWKCFKTDIMIFLSWSRCQTLIFSSSLKHTLCAIVCNHSQHVLIGFS